MSPTKGTHPPPPVCAPAASTPGSGVRVALVPRHPRHHLGRHVATRQLGHPRDLTEARDRHDPGQDRHGHARGVGPLEQPEVVGLPEEHLGDRELGTGVLLGPQHPDVVVEPGRLPVTLGERRDAHAERAEGADQSDQLAGVGEPALGRGPRRARTTGRVAAEHQHVADAGRRVGADHRAELLLRVPHAGQVCHRHHRRLTGDPLGDLDGAVPGRAAGAVRHRDERRPQRLQLAQRPPQRDRSGLVLGREELEGEGPSAGGDEVDQAARTGACAGGRVVRHAARIGRAAPPDRPRPRHGRGVKRGQGTGRRGPVVEGARSRLAR